MSEDMKINAAAALYSSQTPDKNALSTFVLQLKRDGLSVGGILQEPVRDDEGKIIGVDAIALDNGDRFPIVRPSKTDLAAGSCGLNQSVLTESSLVLRRAIAAKVHLIVVEKFGEREQLGEGLADDILSAMAEGIPVLVAVPMQAKEKWVEFTGGLGDLLLSELPLLENWWAQIQNEKAD